MPILGRKQEARNPELPVYDYFDRIRIWLRQPISKQREKWLLAHCGPHSEIRNKLAWFDPHYCQCLDLRQPPREALDAIKCLDNPLVNYVEVTRDLILPDEASTQELVDLFNDCFVQPWHAKMKSVTFPQGGSTRRSPEPEERSTGRWFHWYGDHPGKLTGEFNSFHFEGRHQGVQFVRRIGIKSPADLLNFDFDAYFEKHITLCQIDFERLGRFHDNRQKGWKRRTPHISPRGYHFDERRGGALYRVLSLNENGLSRSLQTFVDRYGRGPFLRPLKDHPLLYMFMSTKRSFETNPFSSNANS